MSGPQTRRRFNPVAWLVVGIPAATVVAGVWTLMLAAGDSATDAPPDQVLVSVLPTAGTRAPVLMLRHPIESSLDRALALSPHPGGWRSGESLAAAHGWQLQLVAADGSWRLVGRYRPGDTKLVLRPALAPP